MWYNIMNGKSIAYSWLSAFGWGAWPVRRNAGYIVSGPCRRYWNNTEGKEILSYIHNDHFWGYPMGGTLPDPSKTFIEKEGFCYYAYASGDYNHRSYTLSNNGNPFLENNYIKIGVNPITGEILSVKTNITAVERDKEVVDKKKVDTDFDKLVYDNRDPYYKGYYKEGKQYRPAIYKMDESNIEIINKY